MIDFSFWPDVMNLNQWRLTDWTPLHAPRPAARPISIGAAAAAAAALTAKSLKYYAWGVVLVAVGAGAREPGDRWCVAFVACRCGL